MRSEESAAHVCVVLYLLIERFHNGDAVPVYRRMRDQGRSIPNGLHYVTSWVTTDLRRCYQVMETDDLALLEEWMAGWADLVDFEVVPVITSVEARAQVEPRL